MNILGILFSTCSKLNSRAHAGSGARARAKERQPRAVAVDGCVGGKGSRARRQWVGDWVGVGGRFIWSHCRLVGEVVYKTPQPAGSSLRHRPRFTALLYKDKACFGAPLCDDSAML